VRLFMCLAIGLIGMTVPASADDSSSRPWWRQRTVLEAGQVVQGDYVAFAPRVVISGTVNGDVYAAGGRVLVDGVINGDLIAAGRKVILSGKVSQNARIAGAHVVLSGSVGRNMTAGAAGLQVTEAGRIQGNILAAGGEVELEGQIGREARIAAGTLVVSDKIGGDLAVAAETVRLTSQATVGGKLRYWSETAPMVDEGATIRGAMTHREFSDWWQVEWFRGRGFAGLRVMATVISLVSTLVLGLVLLRIYPFFTRRAASIIRDRPMRALGWGTAALVGIPLVAVVFLATVFGMPVGVILMGLYMVMLYLSRVYAMTWFGQVLLRRTADSSPLAWSFVMGLAVYALLSVIPVVGELVTLATVLFGLGALLAAEKDLVALLRKEQMV
jgi:cytoskeletal protein CcmA (bactofilin family)